MRRRGRNADFERQVWDKAGIGYSSSFCKPKEACSEQTIDKSRSFNVCGPGILQRHLFKD